MVVSPDPSDPSTSPVIVKGDSDGRLYLAPVTPVEKTADGQVKGSAGTLYAYKIQFVGVTAGD